MHAEQGGDRIGGCKRKGVNARGRWWNEILDNKRMPSLPVLDEFTRVQDATPQSSSAD